MTMRARATGGVERVRRARPGPALVGALALPGALGAAAPVRRGRVRAPREMAETPGRRAAGQVVRELKAEPAE